MLEYVGNSESWPTLIKGGQRQVANLLWHQEGLYVDLPFGYVHNLTQFFSMSSSSEVIHHVHKVRFPPRLYYPLTEANDAYFGNSVLSQISEQMESASKPKNYAKAKVRFPSN